MHSPPFRLQLEQQCGLLVVRVTVSGLRGEMKGLVPAEFRALGPALSARSAHPSPPPPVPRAPAEGRRRR